MERQPVRELPQYEFAKSADLTLADIEAISAFELKARAKSISHIKEREKTFERIGEINGLVANQER